MLRALSTSNNYEPYRIGNGDQISITVWGLQDVFPMTNINVDQNLRRVDSNGDIFFPYIGSISPSKRGFMPAEMIFLDLNLFFKRCSPTGLLQ